MTKQVDRAELLSRWSELAPEECNKSTFINQSESGVWAFNGGAYVSPGRFFPAILLSALIEAIRARGWILGLDIDGTSNSATNKVLAVINELDEGSATGDEPCDVVLAAYVQALEGAATAS